MISTDYIQGVLNTSLTQNGTFHTRYWYLSRFNENLTPSCTGCYITWTHLFLNLTDCDPLGLCKCWGDWLFPLDCPVYILQHLRRISLTAQWLSWCLNGINTLLLPCKQNFQMNYVFHFNRNLIPYENISNQWCGR